MCIDLTEVLTVPEGAYSPMCEEGVYSPMCEEGCPFTHVRSKMPIHPCAKKGAYSPMCERVSIHPCAKKGACSPMCEARCLFTHVRRRVPIHPCAKKGAYSSCAKKGAYSPIWEEGSLFTHVIHFALNGEYAPHPHSIFHTHPVGCACRAGRSTLSTVSQAWLAKYSGYSCHQGNDP